MEKSALALRNTISHLAFPLTPSTPLRRSSRLSEPKSVEVKEEASSPSLDRLVQAKRRNVKSESEGESPKKKPRLVKRGYAPPETYAHLDALSDHLALNLDVIFCGINPGFKSATDGHHFANPTNHFWRGLHLSGFTPRLLLPSEDSTLPSLYNLGLTNLVDRPSTEQAELSKEEMRLSVPTLKAKIIHHRPRIVCFVGKGIWQTVEAAFKQQIHSTSMPTSSSSTPRCKPKRQEKVVTPWGLQPYKLIYNDNPMSGEEEALGSTALNTETPPAVRETLFFVMPSTSGRVVSHQLTDKEKLFARLRSDLEAVKSHTLETATMAVVPLV